MLLLFISTLSVYQAALLSNKADRVSTCRFTLFKEALTRAAAAERCSVRGVLAEVMSEEENKEVLQLLQLEAQDKAWIGLSYTSGEWRWDTGNFLSGFSKLSGDNYGSLTSGLDTYITTHGTWNVSTVKELLPFVCRINEDYMAITSPVTRNAAKAQCERSGMTLAAARKGREVKAIKKAIRSEDRSHLFNWFWLGGRDAIAQGDWLWEDDSVVWDGSRSALKWEYGVTTPREGPLYLAFNKMTGRVRALHEQFKNPYVCQCPPPPEPQIPKMQSDYGSINSYGKYVPLFRKHNKKNRSKMNNAFRAVNNAALQYKFVNKVVTHGEAERHCQRLGGHLACPRNSLQQNLIKDTIRGNAWLGVVDVDEEQVYTCVGEEGKALTFTNWYQRFGIWAVPEPDNMTDRMKPGASYVQILYDSLRSWRHGKWIDRGSPQYEYVVKSAFVCEISDKS